MKIVGINSSPRRAQSRTARLVRAVLDGASSAGATTEFIDLCAHRLGFCTGCANCYATGECVILDDFADIYGRMTGADGVVLGSPNYIRGPTAQIKQFIDRMADGVHCKTLDGKYGCAVCTSGGGGDDTIIAYLNEVLFLLGAQTVGGVGVALGADEGAIEGAVVQAEALGRALAEAIATKREYPDQLEQLAEDREHFRNLVTWNRDAWTHEYGVWAEKGWL
jgi:multimeric flavodoxin WrbA